MEWKSGFGLLPALKACKTCRKEGSRITILKDKYWKRLGAGENEVYHRAQPEHGDQEQPLVTCCVYPCVQVGSLLVPHICSVLVKWITHHADRHTYTRIHPTCPSRSITCPSCNIAGWIYNISCHTHTRWWSNQRISNDWWSANLFM